ncbi:MAG: aldo/keto reductase, partial [Planctomycetia bacterium]|nr:aldo/keto reductase [Planctomycetia bacterium]
MEGSHESCGGNRRRFLKTTAATGAALASADRLLAMADAPAGSTIPLVTLGKTGQKVTRLGMGSSISGIDRSHVQNALFAGVRYIDTSEAYENTVAEKVIGEVLERTRMRNDVYLVSKCQKYENTRGEAALAFFESHLNPTLERLRTDHVDAYYIHGIHSDRGGDPTPALNMLKDPGVKAAFEALKKAGKIRFAGLSCHDARLPEILEAAAEVGWIDQVMIKFNFRNVGNKDRYDDLNRAIDKASRANIGLVAMKTQSGAAPFPANKKELEEKGVKVKDLHPSEKRVVEMLGKDYKREVAAIKTVWMDGRMQVVVSEMTNRDQVRENVAASREPLTEKEARLLEEHRKATAQLYCHGCGHHCETAARGVPVATVLRYYRYYEAYGKRERARELYQALPAVSRQLVDA